MTIPQIVGLIVGAITIISTIVAVAVHLTKLNAQVQQGKLESKLDSMQDKLSATQERLTDNEKLKVELESKLRETLTVGTLVAGKKSAIDFELANISDAVESESCSILVPVPSEIDEEAKELVFLSLLGKGSEKLKGMRVPMGSIAGDVFKTMKSRITHTPLEESTVSAKTDKVSKTQTTEMLALPLVNKDKCIGVIEFLNKRGNKQFDDLDLQRVERGIGSISSKVNEFIQDPNNFALLGITPKTRATEATILFSDISRSIMLLRQLDASVVIDFLNDYFEALCTVAIHQGGRIDKFIGDGFMITFNVQHPAPQHELKASMAALDMQKEFDAVKSKWKIFNIPDVYNRIGINSGLVRKAEVGHSFARQLTVMGEAVSTAGNLCELGVRNRNVIIIGDNLYKKVSSNFNVTKIQNEDVKESKLSSLTAYELLSIKQ